VRKIDKAVFRAESWWRCSGRVSAWAVIASLARLAAANAQTALPLYDPATVAALSFRPGSADSLLLATGGPTGQQAHLVQVTAGGRAQLTRTLPGTFTALAWLDGADGRLESWPIDGGEPVVLATLPEPILGLGVAPLSHSIALRLGQTLRLLAADGRPNGPTITLGGPARPSDVCPPDGIERAPAFAPNERLLVFSGLCGDLRVSGRDGGRLMHADLPRGPVKRYVFAADGHTLLVTYDGPPGPSVDLLPLAPGRLGNPRELAASPSNGEPADVAALPDTEGFVVLSGDRLRFVGPDGSALRTDVTLGTPRRIAVSSGGKRIAVAAAEGLVLFDGNGQRLVSRPFGDFGAPLATRPIAGGTQIAALYADGQLRTWRLDGNESREPLTIWKETPADVPAQAPHLLASPDGRKIAVLAPSGQLDIFDEAGQRVGRPMRFPADSDGKAINSTLLLDDRLLRPLPDGTGFLAFGFDGRVLGRMTFGDNAKIVAEAAAASAGVIAIYAADGRLAAWTTDGRPLRQRMINLSGVRAPRLEIAADGKTVVFHDTPLRVPPHLLVWKPADDTLESRDGAFAGFLGDGSLLRTSRDRLIVDAPDGVTRVSLPYQGNGIAAVTPDGKLALVDRNGGVEALKLTPTRP
jgi:hypothetical protein